MAEDDLRSRTTRSVGWIVLERWSSRLVSLLVLALLTRALTPAEFGLVATAVSLIAILQAFVDSGLSKSLIQRKELGPKDATTVFWTGLSLALVLGGLICLLAPLLARAFGQPDLTPIVQILSLLLPISALSQTPAALLERELEFKALSIRKFVGTLAGAAAAVLLVLLGAGVWALVVQNLVTAAVAVVVLWASTSWRPSAAFSFASLKTLLRTGLPILGIDLLDAAQANLDKLVIGALFSPEVLGYYFVAQRVGIIASDLLVSVFSRVTLSTFSRVQHDRERLNRIFRQMTYVAGAVSVIMFGLLAVFAPQVLATLFGDQWDDAVPILRVLAPGWALGSIMFFDRSMFIATSNATSGLVLALVQNVVSIALLFAFAPFGILGVAFSRLARLVVWPLRLYVLRRAAGVDIGKYILQVLRCVTAAAPVLVGLSLLLATPWADAPAPFWTFVAPASLLGLLTYAGLLWLIAGEENRVVLRSVSRDVVVRFRGPATT
jgi:teichuronic acid exporter